MQESSCSPSSHKDTKKLPKCKAMTATILSTGIDCPPGSTRPRRCSRPGPDRPLRQGHRARRPRPGRPARRGAGHPGSNGAGKTTFVRTVATLVAPTAGPCGAGHDVVADPLAVRRDIGLAGQYAAVEPTMTGRENLEMTARLFGHAARARRAAASSSSSSAWRRWPTAGAAPTRAASAVASTWAPAWSVPLACCCSTSRPPASTPPAGARCGRPCGAWWPPAPTSLLTTHYLDEADALADQVVVIDHGRAIASGTLGELKASVGRDVIEVGWPTRGGLEQVGQILERVTVQPPRLDRSGPRARSRVPAGPSDWPPSSGA